MRKERSVSLTQRQFAGMFSSASDEWGTPQSLFDELNQEFRFTIDVCALPHNAKCDRFYSPDDDGLAQEWQGICWMNPPYGRSISEWVCKAYRESQRGSTIVCLLPARTDTAWFHNYVLGKAEIRWIRGRLSFNDGEGKAPFPSMIVVFRPL